MLIAGRLWFIYVLLITGISAFIFLPGYLYFLYAAGQRSHIHAHRLRKINSRIVIFLAGIQPKIYNSEYLDKNRPVIYCPNHTSYLDIILFLAVIPGNYGFVGKYELLRNPILRIFFGKTDIPVRRESMIHSTRAFEKAAGYLKENRSIVIFPEGGIKATVPRVAPFKAGAFRLAEQIGCPIIPVLFADNYKILPDAKFFLKPGKARIYIHPPCYPENNSGHNELKEEVFRTLKSGMDKLLKNEDRS